MQEKIFLHSPWLLNLPKGTSAVKYTYTPQNRLETMTDAMGNITRYEYDRAGNVTKEYYNGEERYSNTYTALNQLETTTAQGDATISKEDYDKWHY